MFIALRVAVIKNKQETAALKRLGRTWDPCALVVGMQNGAATEANRGDSSKTKHPKENKPTIKQPDHPVILHKV